MPTPVLENPEHQTKWYSRYFLGKFHRNYVGQDATDAKSIYALSGELSKYRCKCVSHTYVNSDNSHRNQKHSPWPWGKV